MSANTDHILDDDLGDCDYDLDVANEDELLADDFEDDYEGPAEDVLLLNDETELDAEIQDTADDNAEHSESADGGGNQMAESEEEDKDQEERDRFKSERSNQAGSGRNMSQGFNRIPDSLDNIVQTEEPRASGPSGRGAWRGRGRGWGAPRHPGGHMRPQRSIRPFFQQNTRGPPIFSSRYRGNGTRFTRPASPKKILINPHFRGAVQSRPEARLVWDQGLAPIIAQPPQQQETNYHQQQQPFYQPDHYPSPLVQHPPPQWSNLQGSQQQQQNMLQMAVTSQQQPVFQPPSQLPSPWLHGFQPNQPAAEPERQFPQPLQQQIQPLQQLQQYQQTLGLQYQQQQQQQLLQQQLIQQQQQHIPVLQQQQHQLPLLSQQQVAPIQQQQGYAVQTRIQEHQQQYNQKQEHQPYHQKQEHQPYHQKQEHQPYHQKQEHQPYHQKQEHQQYQLERLDMHYQPERSDVHYQQKQSEINHFQHKPRQNEMLVRPFNPPPLGRFSQGGSGPQPRPLMGMRPPMRPLMRPQQPMRSQPQQKRQQTPPSISDGSNTLFSRISPPKRQKRMPDLTNLHAVDIVETLPETAETFQEEEEDDEDDEAREYRLRIEEQKRKREEFLQQKEERRVAAALEKQRALLHGEEETVPVTKPTAIATLVNRNPVFPVVNRQPVTQVKLSPTQAPRIRPPIQSQQIVTKPGLIQQNANARVWNKLGPQVAVNSRVGKITMNKPLGGILATSAFPRGNVLVSQVPPTGRGSVMNTQAAGRGAPQGAAVGRGGRMVPQGTTVGRGGRLILQGTPVGRGGKASPQGFAVGRGGKVILQPAQTERKVLLKGVPTQRIVRPPMQQRIVQVPQFMQKLPQTKYVSIENLSASTTDLQLLNMCQSVGQVENFEMVRPEKRANVIFENPMAAALFFKSYHRKMIDLSHINVNLHVVDQ